ncbi:MAG: hypothetical protein QOH82_1243 [Mycobacterium sp.]|nr:hypothetical protein [Mycobacterium sp.]
MDGTVLRSTRLTVRYGTGRDNKYLALCQVGPGMMMSSIKSLPFEEAVVQFVAITTVKPSVIANPPADYSLHLQEESAQTRRALGDGVFHQAWLKADLSGVVVILEAASLMAATAWFDDFSLVHAQYADVQITALDPFSPGDNSKTRH